MIFSFTSQGLIRRVDTSGRFCLYKPSQCRYKRSIRKLSSRHKRALIKVLNHISNYSL